MKPDAGGEGEVRDSERKVMWKHRSLQMLESDKLGR